MSHRTALHSRLGDRARNEDRCLVLEHEGRLLLAVADGMGGHARGDLAAQTVIDSLAWQFRQQRGSPNAPGVFMRTLLENAHFEVVQAGRKAEPPVRCRATCVACLVDGERAFWGHLGDSRLYLLRDGRVWTRTRDHTPVEDMLQAGLIEAHELNRHPLRNSVSRCLGGQVAPHEASLGEARLQPDDVLLLCSDGLWSVLDETRLASLGRADDLDAALDRLTAQAEHDAHPRSDNVSAVALRWSGQPEHAPAGRDRTPPVSDADDPLQQAIEEIERAIEEYAPEMQKQRDD